MKVWLAPFLGLSLMAAIGWSTTDMSSEVNPPMRRIRTDQGDSSVTGQFQTSASGWLWAYTEEYLHNGIKIRKMTEAEKKATGLDDGKNHGMTVIPLASQDFRGILGDVERSISAWDADQNHRQNDPRQCLPLFRLMTWLDPNFVEGWTTGASVIAMDHKEEGTGKALAFLREGSKRNPDCVDIPMMFGMLLVTRRQELKPASTFFKEAIQNGKSRFDVLSENEKSALQNSYRWLALVYRNMGQVDKLEKTVEEGMRYFPDDMVMPITNRASVMPPENYKPPVGVRTRALPRK